MAINWTDAAIEAAVCELKRWSAGSSFRAGEPAVYFVCHDEETVAGYPDRYTRDVALLNMRMRAALDAAAELQGLETIGYRASEKAFEGGRRVGRAEALEEAARACEGDFDSEMRAYGKAFANFIRALKEKKG